MRWLSQNEDIDANCRQSAQKMTDTGPLVCAAHISGADKAAIAAAYSEIFQWAPYSVLASSAAV